MELEPQDFGRKDIWIGIALILAVLLVVYLSGCKTVGRIRDGKTLITGVADAGKPATLATGESKQEVIIPAATPVSVTKIEAVPATDTTPFQPAREVFSFTPPKETRWQAVSSTLRADTGTVDTSVAKHRIDVAERRWLLWTAIACGIGGLVLKSMLPAWPGLSNGLLLAALLAAVAWKLADVPAWLWLVAIGVVVFIALGYKRAELDKDGDGVPDILQSKRTPQQ